MKYEVTVQAISQGHVTVEADSPEKAEAAARSKLFTGAIHWESTKMEYSSAAKQKAYIIHPTTRRTSNRLPMPEPVRKGFRRYSCAVLTGAMILGLTMPAYAANDPLTVVNNLSTFIFGLIRAVGLILLGWGIVQVGLSLQSHDPSQRSNGFLTLAGGIVITFAKEILDLIIA